MDFQSAPCLCILGALQYTAHAQAEDMSKVKPIAKHNALSVSESGVWLKEPKQAVSGVSKVEGCEAHL